MSLREYKRKRSFGTTPEPPDKPIKTGQKLHFVVQKHAASHLHYDFRLEMNGVLKSWAVPKGPSLNPSDKRLAIMVEDHPYDYKDFEGIIPPGNYGAGKVIIWDEGTYELIPPGNLAKGSIKFILHGKKLQGIFSLVKLKKTEKQWLLLKLKDKFASKRNVLTQTKSVRSNAKILEKKPMPALVKPMLAYLTDEPFNRKGWIFEIKWDGYRIIAYVNRHQVKLLSRKDQNYTEIFQIISEELATLKINAIFDGEMVVIDAQGRPDFQLLQDYQKSGQGILQYCVFDLLWLNGNDLCDLPLIQRKKLLKKNLPKLNYVILSEHVEIEGKEFFNIAKKERLEGIMAKDENSPYLSGQRSHAWLKIKTKQKQEVIICGFTAPRGSRTHFGALILGAYRKQQLEYIGHVGTGLSTAGLSSLKKNLDKLTQPHCPFKTAPTTNMPVTWVKPKLVCEVEFSEWTRDGLLRQPVFLGLREDKSAEEVYPEKSLADEKIITQNKHKIKLTHLTKLLWPEDDLTKGDMIQYYQNIAAYILPHLKNRPQSLHRHPNGINEKGFYQKNFEDAPDWATIHLVHSEHENRDIHYFICKNEADLIYLAQLGCIEINPWLSRIARLNFPDFCVLDLDPEDIDFTAVVQTAQTIHKLLTKVSIDHYCKTSGATGLHIYLPLGAKYSYQQSTQFAELIAIIVNNQIPEITSIKRLPSQRQGKVYIDFLQNRKGQTVAAPYSLRPRPQAPISTPLQWREVNSRLDPVNFNIHTIRKRVDKYGDLWKPLLKSKGIDILTSIEKLNKYSSSDK